MATACATSFLSTRRVEILEWRSRAATLADHELLGVSAGCGRAELRAAFARLAKRFHPDAVGACEDDLRREVQEIFVRISDAYQALAARPLTPEPPRAARGPVPPRAPAPPVPPLPSAAPVPPVEPAPPVAPRPPIARTDGAPAPPVPPLPSAAPATGGATPAATRQPAPVWRHEHVQESLARAEELLARGETAAVVDTLHEVAALARGSARHRVRMLLARVYLREKRWTRNALALLDEAVREDPRDAEALALLGGFYLRQGLLARAEGMLRRAVSADPANASLRSELRSVRSALADRRAALTEPPAEPGLVTRILAFGRKRS